SFFRDNALSIAALLLFLFSLLGQALTGLSVTNAEAREHGAAVVSFGQYIVSGDFVEATFENWESEFLQMAVFVVLTKYLRQKGSSESKAIGEHEEVDEDPRTKKDEPEAPGPVRRGGIMLALYERSLSLSLLALFVLSFVLHAVGGASKHNQEALRHGTETVTTLGYLATSQFWFESFQNWQSEFLSVAALVLLSIVLRERGSSQSKPVAAPHAKTGGG
ncbi:MAG TPA: DUF6766 family protein, partial [Labilithrix sp.]|nr:DUF6766 family protein [Labilithrix sp.]